MGGSNVINDIKVIFFIVNTIVGLLAGLLSISVGVSIAVITQVRSSATSIAPIIVGLIVLGLAALGYAGAIQQNRIMLFVYTGVMVLAGVFDIVYMAMIEVRESEIYLLTPPITHLSLVVLAIILAVVLAVKSRNQSNQGMILSPPPAAYIPVA